MWLHTADCPHDKGEPPTCGTVQECRGEVACLEQVSTVDEGLVSAMQRLSSLVDRMLGRVDTADALSHIPGMSTFASLAWVSGRVQSDDPDEWPDTFNRCFQVLVDAVSALRLATNARIPNLTIERVWPQYFVLHEYDDGSLETNNLVIVEHGVFGASGRGPASDVELERAAQIFEDIRNQNPLEQYWDFTLSAHNAAHTDGDYVEAVLKAATAAEVLIKNAAAMLVWEATAYLSPPTPAWAVHPQGVFAQKPAKLIGGVLAAALGGDWDSRDARKPVGAWRHHVARLRSRTLHRGHRPSDVEADQAIAALHQLEGHLCDLLAQRAERFPRSAVLLVGLQTLEKRGAAGKVRATLADSQENWLSSYQAWTAKVDVAVDGGE